MRLEIAISQRERKKKFLGFRNKSIWTEWNGIVHNWWATVFSNYARNFHSHLFGYCLFAIRNFGLFFGSFESNNVWVLGKIGIWNIIYCLVFSAWSLRSKGHFSTFLWWMSDLINYVVCFSLFSAFPIYFLFSRQFSRIGPKVQSLVEFLSFMVWCSLP